VLAKALTEEEPLGFLSSSEKALLPGPSQ
jgi:hypothetical protein